MKSFRFFQRGLTVAHDCGWIVCNEWFYTVAKKDYWFTYPSGKRKLTRKYSIAPRYIASSYKDKFVPDHELLWYWKCTGVLHGWLANRPHELFSHHALGAHRMRHHIAADALG